MKLDEFRERTEKPGSSLGHIQDWVVGRSYHKGVAVAAGDVVAIEREPGNEHDANAFAVYKNGDKIGYLPRETARLLAEPYDHELVYLKGSLTGDDTSDGCAPLRLSVYFPKESELSANALVNGEKDCAFADLFAAWRDRKEYDLETLRAFSKKQEERIKNEGSEYSSLSVLVSRMLATYCAENYESVPADAGELPLFEPDEPKENPVVAERKLKMLNYLKTEGYVPNLDSDGDVHFKYEGGHYFVCFNNEDTDFFRIIYPKFWSIDDEVERDRVVRAADRATARTKVAKIFTVDGETWGSIELFISDFAQVEKFFPRMMSALKTAINTFLDTMRSSEEE